jgi:hypothetical protein
MPGVTGDVGALLRVGRVRANVLDWTWGGGGEGAGECEANGGLRNKEAGHVVVGTSRPKRVPTTVTNEMIMRKLMFMPKYSVKSQSPSRTSNRSVTKRVIVLLCNYRLYRVGVLRNTHLELRVGMLRNTHSMRWACYVTPIWSLPRPTAYRESVVT